MKKRIHVVMPDWQYECARRMAKELGVSISEVLRVGFDFLELSKHHKPVPYSYLMKGEVKKRIDQMHHDSRVVCELADAKAHGKKLTVDQLVKRVAT